MSLWSRLASLVRSPAGPGRALDPKMDLKLLKFEDECAQNLLESEMQKRFNEQNMRMSKVKSQKSLLQQKLERELSINKSMEEFHAEKIRVLGNDLLFKYMNHGVIVVAVGALLGSLLTTPRLHPQMESLGKGMS